MGSRAREEGARRRAAAAAAAESRGGARRARRARGWRGSAAAAAAAGRTRLAGRGRAGTMGRRAAQEEAEVLPARLRRATRPWRCCCSSRVVLGRLHLPKRGTQRGKERRRGSAGADDSRAGRGRCGRLRRGCLAGRTRRGLANGPCLAGEARGLARPVRGEGEAGCGRHLGAATLGERGKWSSRFWLLLADRLGGSLDEGGERVPGSPRKVAGRDEGALAALSERLSGSTR